MLALSFLLGATNAPAYPTYPLKLSPGNHYVLEQDGTPFLIQGASPWYVSALLNGTNVDYYFNLRAAQGYNSVILDLAGRGSTEDAGIPTNLYGQYPFTNMIAGPFTNLASWNARYFTNVDHVLQRAGCYGLCVFAYPLYDGFNAISWYGQMAANSTNALFSYGQFIGNRYKNFTNIVWVGAGDYDEPGAPYLCPWNWVAAGIRSADTNHLITAQPARQHSALQVYTAFVNLNSTYPGIYTYQDALANYQATPVLASFNREPYYEYRTGIMPGGRAVNAHDCRCFAWWSVLAGDAGQIYGNEFEWHFTPGWQAQIMDEAAVTIPYLGKLMNARLWWNCVPDFNHTTITSGYGTNGTMDYVACTREATGKTVVAYISQDALTPTVNMTRISGATANAWWYNPRTGAGTNIATYATTGTRTFTPPDTNDWVLVLDDASQNYPPPGVAVDSMSIKKLGGSVFQLTAAGAPGQIYTLQVATNRFNSWQTFGTGTADYSGKVSLQVTGIWSPSLFRSVH